MPGVQDLLADPRFGSLSTASQRALLSRADPSFEKLSDDGILKLRARVRPGVPTPTPPEMKTNDEGFGSSLWDSTGKPIVKLANDIGGALAGRPQETHNLQQLPGQVVAGLADIVPHISRNLSASGQSMLSGHPIDALWHLAGAVPGVGPAAQQVATDFEQGDPLVALGHMTGLVGPMLVPELGGTASRVVKATKPVVKAAVKGGTKAALEAPGSVYGGAAAGGAGYLLSGGDIPTAIKAAEAGAALPKLAAGVKGGYKAGKAAMPRKAVPYEPAPWQGIEPSPVAVRPDLTPILPPEPVRYSGPSPRLPGEPRVVRPPAQTAAPGPVTTPPDLTPIPAIALPTGRVPGPAPQPAPPATPPGMGRRVAWKDIQPPPTVVPDMAAQPATNPIAMPSGRKPGKPTQEMLDAPIKVTAQPEVVVPIVAPAAAAAKSAPFTMKDVHTKVRPVYEDLRKRHGMSGAGDAWTKDNQITQHVKSLGVDRKKWMNASQAEHEAWIKQAGDKAKAAGLSKSGYKAPGLEGGRSRSYHTLVDHIGRLLELEK